MYGMKQPAPIGYQGCDILGNVTLYYDGKPIDPEAWDLKVVVKRSLKELTPMWCGDMKLGLYTVDATNGLYRFRIPADISKDFPPGAYFYTVIGYQHVGTEPFAIKANLASGMFDLDLDATSPNPQLPLLTTNNLIIDNSMALLVMTTALERTEPEILEVQDIVE